MATLAVLALALFTLVHCTVFHYQRFTLGVSRQMGASPGEVPRLQAAITPTWLGALGWVAYPVLIAAAVIGFRIWGWPWVVSLVVWAFVGSALLDVVWALPTEQQCRALATREVSAGLGRAVVSHDAERQEAYSSLLAFLMAGGSSAQRHPKGSENR